MMRALSENTQAILLLTAPLLAGRGAASPHLLSPLEYKRLARRLREIEHQPSDLIALNATEILHACQSIVAESRLRQLLERGFLLSQVVERWHARAIWVVSRADAEYPRRLKTRLREDAPAVLYGCGDIALLETGGIAVVGSRHADDVSIDYAMAIGRLTAQAGRTLVSGGARGIDQAAMRGASEANGNVCGVLADSLEKASMNRGNRNHLLDGQLAFVSPYDPNAGFNVGNAMQRNKLIYALADLSLVVSSDLNKGGTWTGAVEQLDKLKFAPVFVRSTGDSSPGLDALRTKGALPWPDPQDARGLERVFSVTAPAGSPQFGFALLPDAGTSSNGAKPPAAVSQGVSHVSGATSNSPVRVPEILDTHPLPTNSEVREPTAAYAAAPFDEVKRKSEHVIPPAELLLTAIRAAIQQLLRAPMNIAEVAGALDVSNAQAKLWLERLVEEDLLERLDRPVRFVVKSQQSLLTGTMSKKRPRRAVRR